MLLLGFTFSSFVTMDWMVCWFLAMFVIEIQKQFCWHYRYMKIVRLCQLQLKHRLWNAISSALLTGIVTSSGSWPGRPAFLICSTLGILLILLAFSLLTVHFAPPSHISMCPCVGINQFILSLNPPSLPPQLHRLFEEG